MLPLWSQQQYTHGVVITQDERQQQYTQEVIITQDEQRTVKGRLPKPRTPTKGGRKFTLYIINSELNETYR